MDIEKVKEKLSHVEGWLSEKEGKLLYNLAKNCKGKGVIVEIGSWKGKSTIWLSYGSKEGPKSKIFAIDPHIGEIDEGKIIESSLQKFKYNITNAGVSDIVESIIKTSQEGVKDVKEPVELIFIDGLHEYDYVKLDFELWFPKIINNGTIAFHDFYRFGVTRFIKKYILTSNHFRNIGFADSILYAEKVEHNSIADRIKNKYIISLKVCLVRKILKSDLTSRVASHVPDLFKNFVKMLLGI